ncbi:MAG: hypothetical protein QXT86_11305 [Archaeoglobaceae archaeon]
MKYKAPKTYKGFEVWYHALQMTLKMHLYIILIILLLQFLIVFLYWLLLKTEELMLVLRAFFSFSYSHMIKAVRFFVLKSIFIFLLAQVTWLLYPMLLAQFKAKSQEIMKDEHLRGNKLVSEEELRELVIKRIEEEYRRYRENAKGGER